MKTKCKEISIVVLLLTLVSLCFASWDNTKPADNQTWNSAAGSIRDNWDALEVILGTDLSSGYKINIKHPPYNATGNGTTDDTAAIQAALDADGQDIFIPEGVFLCNLTVDGAVNIRGCGPKSILKAKLTTPVITVTERITAAISGQGSALGRRFENFTISGNGKTAKGIYYDYSTPWTVEEEIVGIYFDNCTRGIDFGTSGAIGNTVRYCNFVTCDYGIYARNSGANAGGLNLNCFSENRFRSIILCGIYLNGSDVSLGGNDFHNNWFEGIDGFGIILMADASQGRLRRPNSIKGGWFESVAPVAQDPVTLDDEGSTATRNIWLKDTSLISTNGILPADILVDGSILHADYYRGGGVSATKNQIVAVNDAEILIDEAYLDGQGGVVMKGISTSSLVVRRPHSYSTSSKNRGFIVEGLPMVNQTGGHTNLAGIQSLTDVSGATLTYQANQFLGSNILRCALSDNTEEAISGNLSINNSKYYAFSFAIKSSTSSAEDDITFELNGTGTLFGEQTIIARGDRWTHYTGCVYASSSAPIDQKVRFGTSADATFDLSRLQLVEFATLAGAHAFLHNQQYASSKDVILFTHWDDAIDDDGTVNLPDATSGMVFVSCNAEAGMWIVQNDGTVAKIAGSANTAAADTDTDLCVYDGGTDGIVKNRLGAAGEIRIFYYHN